jgi:catechol 2,3-dioxygenase-like lactoylglutathione lyase family enzyme
MELRPPVPILRMYDLEKTKAFYVGFLGFTIDWEHRFTPESPVYMQVTRDGCRIHLSEHHGDATPISSLRIEVPGDGALEAWQQELRASGYKYYKPGLQDQEWGTREMSIQDPSGNKLIFYRELPRTKS